MNYLAHAVGVLGEPWLVAGTSLPDWLRALDKRARAHPAKLALLVVDDARVAQLRDGVHKHHEDDHDFHTHAVFEAITGQAVQMFRALSPDARFRASALGHIVVEMLLDACIEEHRPGAVNAYYAALTAIDVDVLAAAARAFTGRPLEQLERLFDRFQRARFLHAYATDGGTVAALEGVCARAGLTPPPDGERAAAVVAALRPRVRAALPELLLP